MQHAGRRPPTVGQPRPADDTQRRRADPHRLAGRRADGSATGPRSAAAYSPTRPAGRDPRAPALQRDQPGAELVGRRERPPYAHPRRAPTRSPSRPIPAAATASPAAFELIAGSNRTCTRTARRASGSADSVERVARSRPTAPIRLTELTSAHPPSTAANSSSGSTRWHRIRRSATRTSGAAGSITRRTAASTPQEPHHQIGERLGGALPAVEQCRCRVGRSPGARGVRGPRPAAQLARRSAAPSGSWRPETKSLAPPMRRRPRDRCCRRRCG